MREIDKMVQTVKEGLGMFEAMTGIKFDYTPQSLRKLDKALDEMYPLGEREYDMALAIAFGTYLGEVIVRNIKQASWEELDGHPMDMAVKMDLPSEEGAAAYLKPAVRVNRYLNHDRDYHMYILYASAQDFVKGLVNPTSGDKKWTQTPRNYQYRSVSVSKEEMEAPNFSADKLFDDEK